MKTNTNVCLEVEKLLEGPPKQTDYDLWRCLRLIHNCFYRHTLMHWANSGLPRWHVHKLLGVLDYYLDRADCNDWYGDRLGLTAEELRFPEYFLRYEMLPEPLGQQASEVATAMRLTCSVDES